MHTAFAQLKTRWFISGKETLEAPILNNKESPLNGRKVAYTTV